jgi:N-acetylglucosaminyldiphosphoundecaprenol N-acetyl-beta-D-mannosaminyltransferase
MKNNRKHPIAILGLPLHSLTVDQAVDAIDELLIAGGTHQVCPVNLDVWLNALADPHLHRIMSGCSLVVPDGMPLVWASKLMGCPLSARVTGVDLVPGLAALSARKGYKIFLLGGKPGVADRCADLLRQSFPGANIVGAYAPPEANLIRMDHTEILNRIHAVQPDILLVAFGNPKQEKWIWMHRKKLGVGVAMGVGGSFDMIVGDTCRAPGWIQRSGLEWAMRFLQEPDRLGPRYLRDFLGLGRHLPFALLAAWMQRPYLGPSRITTAITPQVMHIYVHGKLSGNVAEAVEQAATASMANGLVMVVHLQNARQITAAGLGVLMEARRQLLEAGLSLSLAGFTLKTRFLLYAWCLQPLFDEWQPAINRGKPIASAESLAHLDRGLSAEPKGLPVQTRSNG